MRTRVWPAVLGALALLAGSWGVGGETAMARESGTGEREAGDRLGRVIQQRLRDGGPFFTAEERAVIDRACGYAPGSWDGYEVNMSDDVFRCSNGRRVDSAEVRAVMEAAGPRIRARVRHVMESAEVRGAIRGIAERARVDALRAVDAGRIAEEASARALEATERALRRIEETQEGRRRR